MQTKKVQLFFTKMKEKHLKLFKMCYTTYFSKKKFVNLSNLQ